MAAGFNQRRLKRKQAREIAVRLCFAISENPTDPNELIDCTFDEEYYASLGEEDKLYTAQPSSKQIEYIRQIVTGVAEHTEELDGFIEKHSIDWKINRISGTAIAIMRIALYEALYMPDVPISVAINEAVELSKRYETPETRSFINGILGTFSRAGGDTDG